MSCVDYWDFFHCIVFRWVRFSGMSIGGGFFVIIPRQRNVYCGERMGFNVSGKDRVVARGLERGLL